MPDQRITGCEGDIGLELLVVPADLTGGEPLLPHRRTGMGVASCVERAQQLAPVTRSHAVAVSVAPVERRR